MTDAAVARALLTDMIRVRRMEEKCAEMYSAGKIRGFLHLYVGEEAVAAGSLRVLGPQDAVIATYREHAHALLRGIPMAKIMAEMFGKQEGCSGGRGGSMHLFDAERRFYGGNAIVAGGLPTAAGLAFADAQLKRNQVSACYFGDGAIAEGAFHETMNMAELWKLPVVYVIENNKYAMGTSVSRASAQQDFSKRGASFNIPGEQVDGMDVQAVKAAGERALAFAREGNGPYILEMQTYRYRGHSMSDPAKYRSKEEVQKMRTEHDPIEQVRARLLEKHGTSEDDLKKLDAEIREIVNAAADFASNDPEPETAELYTDILR